MPAVTRIGDANDDYHNGPDHMTEGSPNVFANDFGPAQEMIMDMDTASFYVDTTIARMGDALQPTTSLYNSMTHETDDEGAEAYEYDSLTGKILEIDDPANPTGPKKPVISGTVPFTEKQQGVAASATKEKVDIKTPETLSAPAAVNAAPSNTPSQYDSSDIDSTSLFTGSFPLSPNYTLANLTTNTVVSNYPLRAQHGLSERDIVKNLRALCYNILEPLRVMFPGIRVNSGFRHATAKGKSQHERGQAADMSLSSASSNETAWPVAQQIANSSLPYDQFLYEQNMSIWFHLSYNPSGTERRMVLTKSRSQTNPVIGLRQVL